MQIAGGCVFGTPAVAVDGEEKRVGKTAYIWEFYIKRATILEGEQYERFGQIQF